MDTVRVTALVDNTPGDPRLGSEHGLSFWIETDNGPILWDTGQSGMFMENAAVLGIPVRGTKHIALSHGHYDHTGGLVKALAEAPEAVVHVHPDVFVERFAPDRNGNEARSIGIPFDKSDIETRCSRLIESVEPQVILPGVSLTGEIPRVTDFEDTGGTFYLDEGLSEPDPIRDDQSLVIETDDGVVLLLGCCHAGLVNTLTHVEKNWGTRSFPLIAGGTHLLNATGERLRATVDALRNYRIGRFVPGHCTGENALDVFGKAFPDSYEMLSVGWTWANES